MKPSILLFLLLSLNTLSANPFSRFRDEELDMRKNSMMDDNNLTLDSLNQIKIDSTHDQFTQKYWQPPISNQDQSAPCVKYRNYLSYLKDFPFKNLLACNIPILVAYGTKDIHSHDNDLLPYLFAANNNKNLTLKAYPGVEHNFIKRQKNEKGEITEDFLWDKVFKDTMDWFTDKK